MEPPPLTMQIRGQVRVLRTPSIFCRQQSLMFVSFIGIIGQSAAAMSWAPVISPCQDNEACVGETCGFNGNGGSQDVASMVQLNAGQVNGWVLADAGCWMEAELVV